MVLAFDIGNSTIGVALFDRQRISAEMNVPSTVQRTDEEMWGIIESLLRRCGTPRVDTIGISSVVPFQTSKLARLVNDKLNISPLIIDGRLDTGLNIRYDNPSQLGPDRICSAVAAHAKFGGPLIVVDFGTATTYGVIDANGDFLGGSISLGMKSMAEALSQRTAQLPPIDISFPAKAICTNTTTAMQAGVIFGSLDAFEGMIIRLQNELGKKACIIATGGFATMITPHSQLINFCVPSLVLDGVRLICERVKR